MPKPVDENSRAMVKIPEHLQWRTWAADPEGITGNALLTFLQRPVAKI
jgi:hypothetical protein